MGRRLLYLLVLSACGDDSGSSVDGPDARADARPPPDSRADAEPADAAIDGVPWSHTITVDGLSSDWLPGGERLATTTGDHFIWLSWDASNVYLALEGDLAAEPATTLFVACFDADPGLDTGAQITEQAGTEQASFPNGFGGEHCLRRSLDGTTSQLRRWTGAAWAPNGATVAAAQSATFLELGVPRAALGSPPAIGVVALVFDTNTPERAYAGLYSGSFTDGFYAMVPVAYYFMSAFDSSLPPEDPRHRQP